MIETLEQSFAWIVKYGAAGAFGAAGVLLALFQTRIGDRILDYLLARRATHLDHELREKIEKLRARLVHSTDRGARANENEFKALTEIWLKLVEAHLAVQRCIIRFELRSDLNTLDETQLTSFLDTSGLSPQQRSAVEQAKDKDAEYSKQNRWRLVSIAENEIFQARTAIIKFGIFIPVKLEEKLLAALEIISKAQGEEFSAVAFGGQARGDRGAIKTLFKDGQATMDAVKSEIRERLAAFEGD